MYWTNQPSNLVWFLFSIFTAFMTDLTGFAFFKTALMTSCATLVCIIVSWKSTPHSRRLLQTVQFKCLYSQPFLAHRRNIFKPLCWAVEAMFHPVGNIVGKDSRKGYRWSKLAWTRCPFGYNLDFNLLVTQHKSLKSVTRQKLFFLSYSELKTRCSFYIDLFSLWHNRTAGLTRTYQSTLYQSWTYFSQWID